MLSLFWLTWTALSVRAYFFRVGSIGDWTYHEVLIVMGLFFAMNGYCQMVLTPNLSRLSEYVQTRTLDYILTKPIDSQFMVNLRNIGIFSLILQTATIWLVNVERVDTLIMGLLETSRFPVDYYKAGWIRAALTAMVPVAFMTTFPAEALLGRPAPVWP